MKIDLRNTHAFAEISVDTLSETIFYNEEEMENFINNLITIAAMKYIDSIPTLPDKDQDYE